MEALTREAGTSTPSVNFDPETGILEIGGESYPENSHRFYSPIIKWLESYLEQVSRPVVFKITVSYLNTSSTKNMIDMLDRLEEAHDSGKAVSVEWYYDRENERARDTIEEFKEDFAMPFDIIPRDE